MSGRTSAPMRRTQVCLEPAQTEALDRLAARRGVSRAALLREAARRLLREEGQAGEDPLLGMIGMANAGPGNAAAEHDRVLAEAARSST